MQDATRRGTRLGLLLFLSHHPLCSYFRADRVRLGPLSLCLGCTLTWPAFVLAALALVRWTPGPWREALALGLALGVPQVVGAFWRPPLWFRAGGKFLGGAGLALTGWGLLGSPLGAAGTILVVLLGTLGFVALLAMRLRRILATCRACPYAMDWDSCPGMLGNATVGSPRSVPGP